MEELTRTTGMLALVSGAKTAGGNTSRHPVTWTLGPWAFLDVPIHECVIALDAGSLGGLLAGTAETGDWMLGEGKM